MYGFSEARKLSGEDLERWFKSVTIIGRMDLVKTLTSLVMAIPVIAILLIVIVDGFNKMHSGYINLLLTVLFFVILEKSVMILGVCLFIAHKFRTFRNLI